MLLGNVVRMLAILRKPPQPVISVAFGLLVLSGLGACTALSEKTVYDGGKTLTVTILGAAPAPTTQATITNPISAPALEKSLQQVQVRRSEGIFSFNRGKPKPLFSSQQVNALSSTLAQHLPSLGKNQTLVVGFYDVVTGMRYRAKVSWQKGWLRLEFDEFAVNPLLFPHPDSIGPDSKVFQASFFPQKGQQLEYARVGAISVRLPVSSSASSEAQVRFQKRALVAKARKNNVLLPAEAKVVSQWMDIRQDVSYAQWQRYFEKRTTLKNALRQQLFSTEEYAQYLKALNQEIAPNKQPPSG